MKSIAKTFRFSPETVARLSELSEACNPNETETVELAIEFIYSLWAVNKIGISAVLQPRRSYFVGGKTASSEPSTGSVTKREIQIGNKGR